MELESDFPSYLTKARVLIHQGTESETFVIRVTLLALLSLFWIAFPCVSTAADSAKSAFFLADYECRIRAH